MLKSKGATNTGLIVLVVVLLLAVVALLFFWPGGEATEDEAELEVEVGSRPAVVQPLVVAYGPAMTMRRAGPEAG